MEIANLETVKETTKLELPLEALRILDNANNRKTRGISPSKDNAMILAKTLVSYLNLTLTALSAERNKKTCRFMQEEIKNIYDFLNTKASKIVATSTMEIIAAKKFKHFLSQFKLNPLIEVSVFNGQEYEDGWYAFREDTDYMEGFYSTCTSGRINLINSEGKSKYFGLGQISVK